MLAIFVTVSATFWRLFQLHSFFLCRDTGGSVLTKKFFMQTVTRDLSVSRGLFFLETARFQSAHRDQSSVISLSLYTTS